MYHHNTFQNPSAAEFTTNIEAADAGKMLASSGAPSRGDERAMTATGDRISADTLGSTNLISKYPRISFAPPLPVSGVASQYEQSNSRPRVTPRFTELGQHESSLPRLPLFEGLKPTGYDLSVRSAVSRTQRQQGGIATKPTRHRLSFSDPKSTAAISTTPLFPFARPHPRSGGSSSFLCLEHGHSDSLQYVSSRSTGPRQFEALFPEVQIFEDLQSSSTDPKAILAFNQPPQQDEEVAMEAASDRPSFSDLGRISASMNTRTPRTSSRTATLYEGSQHSLGLCNTYGASQHSASGSMFQLQDFSNPYTSRSALEAPNPTITGTRIMCQRRRKPRRQPEELPTPAIARSTASPQAKGLLDLPAELRNHIYELAYTTEPPTQPKIELYDALAPVNKDLLLTCHQIYNEAIHFYRSAYKSYWLDTTFIVDQNTCMVTPEEMARVTALAYDDVQHVRHLEIPASDSNSFVLVDAYGIWKRTTTIPGTDAVTGEDWIVPFGNYWEVEAKIWADEESAWNQCSARGFRRLPVSDQVRFLWQMYGF